MYLQELNFTTFEALLVTIIAAPFLLLLSYPPCAGDFARAFPYILLFSSDNGPAKYYHHLTHKKTKEWSHRSRKRESKIAKVQVPGFEAMCARLQNLRFLYNSILPLDFYCLAGKTGLARYNH